MNYKINDYETISIEINQDELDFIYCAVKEFKLPFNFKLETKRNISNLLLDADNYWHNYKHKEEE